MQLIPSVSHDVFDSVYCANVSKPQKKAFQTQSFIDQQNVNVFGSVTLYPTIGVNVCAVMTGFLPEIEAWPRHQPQTSSSLAAVERFRKEQPQSLTFSQSEINGGH